MSRSPSRKPRPFAAPGRSRRSWRLTVALVVALFGGALAASLLLESRPPDPFEDMVWVEGGSFAMGRDPAQCDSSLCCLPGQKDALPVHQVELDGFWMDRTPVTNARFEAFVKATGYVTVAEKWMARPAPDGQLAALPPGSFVMRPPEGEADPREHMRWWQFVEGADWRHPEGPDSDIKDRGSHPVVQVCWDDAAAYCRWAGKRLPTEAEFEYAARGGLGHKRYVWGDDLTPGGRWHANIWQGKFPRENTLDDGHRTTSPVASFPPNGYGLHDMSGNVWQWCADWYQPDYYEKSPPKNPPGPPDSFDPAEPGVAKRVQRGGSFLCSDLYCQGYQPGSRGKGEAVSAAYHIGFRCARDAKK